MKLRQKQWGEGMLYRLASVFCAVLVFGALFNAAPVAAQLATGRSGSSSTMYVGSEQAWKALAHFGTCYASQRTPKAIELVSTRAGSLEEAKTYKRLFRGGDNCLMLVDEMTVDFVMVRGSVAEGLYRQSIPVPASLAVTTAPTSAQVTSFAEAALCFAASNRASVEELITKTKLGSKAEDETVDRLLPGIATCIPEKARNVSLTAPMIRFRLAEALWRLGHKPATTAAGRS